MTFVGGVCYHHSVQVHGCEGSRRMASEPERFGQRVNRRDFLARAGVGVLAAMTGMVRPARAYGSETPAPQGKPNIVVILADDLGYGDIGVHGCKDIPTPHIDSVARNGVRFSDGYVCAPICSPSRAGILTGRYPQRFGHWYNGGSIEKVPEQFGLPLSEITLANVLKPAGYATGIVGKWHLGFKPEFHPMKRVFDEFFGFLNVGRSYLDPHAMPANPVMRGTERIDEKEYLTDAFTREAVAFIDRHHAEPFFLYLPYSAVHTPMQTTAKYLERFRDVPDGDRRTYAAMLSAMDDGVGAVLATLRRHGLEENSLVFFLSDNGGTRMSKGFSNGPLRGCKDSLLEGGIRVPFLMQWPRRIRGGGVYANPVIALDVFATSVAAAGGTLPADRVMDGVDLIPFATGQRPNAPHNMLFWKWMDTAAARQGQWKLARRDNAPSTLYDLAVSIDETRDVAAARGDIVESMSRALAQWETELKPPLWPPG
jgi:arylsulfatase A-like enzyme